MNIFNIEYPVGNFSKISLQFLLGISIVLIATAIVLAIFSTYVDWDFVKTAYLLIIPIIAGGITTKISTNYWQLNKERLSIKRDFLSDYEKSYKRRSTLSENFLYKIIEPYVIYESDSESVEFEEYSITEIDGTKISEPINAHLKLLAIKDGKPIKTNLDSYTKFQNEIHECSFFSNKFLSSYRLYCIKNEGLEKKIDALQKKLNMSEDIVLRLMHSEDSKQLLNCFKLFDQENKKIIKLLEEIELNMVELKFKKFR